MMKNLTAIYSRGLDHVVLHITKILICNINSQILTRLAWEEKDR